MESLKHRTLERTIQSDEAGSHEIVLTNQKISDQDSYYSKTTTQARRRGDAPFFDIFANNKAPFSPHFRLEVLHCTLEYGD